jgi:hypothetical protein
MAPLSGRDHRIAGSHRLRVVFVSESRVEKAPLEGAAPRRCRSCDVGWYGDAETRCWFCGHPGAIVSDTRRVVADEPAA